MGLQILKESTSNYWKFCIICKASNYKAAFKKSIFLGGGPEVLTRGRGLAMSGGVQSPEFHEHCSNHYTLVVPLLSLSLISPPSAMPTMRFSQDSSRASFNVQ